MFFTSGMTLGYLQPAPVIKKAAEKAPAEKTSSKDWTAPQAEERNCELEKAFLTPWHLFY